MDKLGFSVELLKEGARVCLWGTELKKKKYQNRISKIEELAKDEGTVQLKIIDDEHVEIIINKFNKNGEPDVSLRLKNHIARLLDDYTYMLEINLIRKAIS